MAQCAAKCTGQPTYQRYRDRCHFTILQNFGTSMEVGSSFFLSFALVEQVCHCQFGALHLQGLGWLTQSVLGQLVHAAVMVSWVCLLVSFWLASWLVMHPLHVALEWTHYYHLPPQHFNIHPAPGYGWWVTGNFDVGYSFMLPPLWDIPQILICLDRAVAPPHTPCSPTSTWFCVSPWR